MVGVKIPPPAQLKESDRVGFADQIFDDDGVIRRALLSVRTDNHANIRQKNFNCDR